MAEKKSECSTAEKRRLIEVENKQISLVRQCELLGLSRASLYYKTRSESVENLQLMRLLDEQYTKNIRFTESSERRRGLKPKVILSMKNECEDCSEK